jgi:threonine dehydratase
MEQVKDVDAVIIPVGGGGMIAGVAVAVKTLSPSTLVIVSPSLGFYQKENIPLENDYI